MHKIKQIIRYLTTYLRPYPSFIIGGAQKSGTTSLFYYLSKNNVLIPPLRQEVHYFDEGLNPLINTYKLGLKWYRTNFPILLPFSNLMTYDNSPLYIFHPEVPYRIYQQFPKMKFIFLLRNPVNRAISHYYHEKRKGRENLSMLDAFLSEEDRLKSITSYKSPEYKNYSYKSRGNYYKQLKNYLDVFPEEQIFVVNSERLFLEPGIVVRKICDFLEIPFQKTLFEIHNPGNYSKKVDDKVIAMLCSHFSDQNDLLFALIDNQLVNNNYFVKSDWNEIND